MYLILFLKQVLFKIFNNKSRQFKHFIELKTKPNTGLYRPKGFVLPEGWQMEKVYRKTSSVCDVYYWPPLVKGERRTKCRSRVDLRKKLGDNFINWDLFRYKSGEYPEGEIVRNANFVLDNNKKGNFTLV